MRRLTFFWLLAAVVSGCTAPETYPLSGEECAPDDPVKTVEVQECQPPGGFL